MKAKVIVKPATTDAAERVREIAAKDSVRCRVVVQYFDPARNAYVALRGKTVAFQTRSAEYVLTLPEKIRAEIEL